MERDFYSLTPPTAAPGEVASHDACPKIFSSGTAGSADSATNDIGELIGELQAMLSEALEQQQGNSCSPQLTPVGSTRWREVHSRLMSQAGAVPLPLERASSTEVAELEEALQQSSAALKSSQQQLQLLSARVEELQTQLDADCEHMMASVQEEMQAAHDAHQAEMQMARAAYQEEMQAAREAHQEQLQAICELHRKELQAMREVHEKELLAVQEAQQRQLHEAHQEELRELQERLQVQQGEAAESAIAAAAAREAALRTALSELQQVMQQAEALAEVERGRSWNAQRRLEEYENLCWRLQAELHLPEARGFPHAEMNVAASDWKERSDFPPGHPSPESLLASARALQARFRQEAARSSAAADTACAAAAAAAVDAAAWRSRAEHAELDAARAGLATDEVRQSLGAALMALHEEVASLAAANASLSSDLERRQAQVATLTASGTELEARAARLGAEVTSMAGLQTALQAELLKAGGRHAALEVVISELREEVAVVTYQRNELAAKVLELHGELQLARAQEDAQRLGLENAQNQRDEGARLAVQAADVAADLLNDTRKASDEQLERLRLQIVDLYERLGQARARGLAEAARMEEVRMSERAEERATRAALQDESAASAAAALCARIFRAVERAAAARVAAGLEEVQSLAVRQTVRVICARVAWRQGASEATMAAAEAQKTAQDLQARLAGAKAAVAEAEARLADVRNERDRLSAALAGLQRQVVDSAAVASRLAAQLEEALADGGVARSLVAEADAVASNLRVELQAAHQALQDHRAAALTAEEAAQEQLLKTQTNANALRQQLEAAQAERQHLHQALTAAVAASTALQGQLADSKRDWDCLHVALAELQGRLDDCEAAVSALAVPLDQALALGATARSRASCAGATAAEMRAELKAVQQVLRDQQAAAVAGREQLATSQQISEAQRQQLEVEGAERRKLQEALAAAGRAVEETQARAAATDAWAAHLRAQLDAVTNAMLQQKAEGEAERQQLMERLARANTTAERSEQECGRLAGVVENLQASCSQLDGKLRELQAVLQQAHAELDGERLAVEQMRSELHRECSAHEATNARLQAYLTECAALQAQLIQQQLMLGAAVASDAAAASLQPPEAEAGQSPAIRGGPVGGVECAPAMELGPGQLSHELDDVDAVAEGAVADDGRGEARIVDNPPKAAGPSPRVTERATGECSFSRATGDVVCLQDMQEPARAAGPDAVTREELHLKQQLEALQEVLEAERMAQAVRVVTLRALRSAERAELQRELAKALMAVGAGGIAAHMLPPRGPSAPWMQQGPLSAPTAGQLNVTSVVWELPPAAAHEPKGTAPAAGAGAPSMAGVAANRPHRRSLELPSARAHGVPPSRIGLPPLAPHDVTPPSPQQQQHAQQPGLERCPSRNSNTSGGSRGSSYWLPAAAAMAAAAADYDAYHEPLWVTNAAFGVGIPLGCITNSSAAPSEAPVVELVETIAVLQAELAAAQEALRKARDTAMVADRDAACSLTATAGAVADTESVGSALACSGDVSGGGSIDDKNHASCRNRDEGSASVASQPATPPLFHSAQYDGAAPTATSASTLPSHDVQEHAAQGGQVKRCTVPELERMLEVERGASETRQVVLRALRSVERAALQRELAEARAAEAAAASDARARLAAMLAVHTRVSGELEMLRAAHDELAAEMGPLRRLVERLRNQNDQLRAVATKAAVQHAADIAAAAAAAADSSARIAACEAREAALTVRCQELAARCEGLEAQLARSLSASIPAPGAETVRTATEAGRVQLAAQVLELRAEQAGAAASLERLRVEYAAARHDRQRLQQQLASVLMLTASVQTAAEELSASLRAAHADLDEQKTKLDEQRCEVERAQAESAAVRQQLARARADGRQRAAETRAWARQAVLLQEQLALLEQGARAGLLLRGSTAGGSPSGGGVGTGSPGGPPGSASAATEIAAGAIGGSGHADVVRDSLLDADSMTAAQLTLGMLHSTAQAGCSFSAGMGRRCLSAIDLTSLTRGLEEDAHHQRQLQAQGGDRHGFPGGRGGDVGPFLPGLPALNVHHLALLQGRGFWNPGLWASGAAGVRVQQLAGLGRRVSSTVGGAPLARAPAPAATPPRSAGRIAGDALSNGAGNAGGVAAEPAARPTVVSSLVPVTSPRPFAVSSQPRLLLQQGLQHQDVRSPLIDPSGIMQTSPRPMSATAPAVSVRPHWQAQKGGSLPSPHSARLRGVFTTGQLRRLAEEDEGDGQEVKGDRLRQVEGNKGGGSSCVDGHAHADVLGMEREGGEEGSECDAEDGQDDGASVAVEAGDVAGSFPRAAGRTTSEADMHLFYNPMFTAREPRAGDDAATVRKSLPAAPQSAREHATVWSTSTAASLARSSAGPVAVHATSFPEPRGEPAGSTRRISADPAAAGVSGGTHQVRRLPLWPPPSSTATAAPLLGLSQSAASTSSAVNGGGTEGDGDCDGQEQGHMSRSNRMVKLYKKISRRLSSSRDSRDGLGEAARG